MHDLEIAVDGASGLASICRILGEADVDLRGGGMWSGRAHYLVADGARAVAALRSAGIDAVSRPAVVVPLPADVPGALGRLLARVAADGLDLRAQYSDHDHRKVLVVDEPERARRVLAAEDR